MVIGIDARMYRTSTAGIGRYSQNLIKNLLKIDHENQYILFMTEEDKKEFTNSFESDEVKRGFIKTLMTPEDKREFTNSFMTPKIITIDIPHYSIAEQLKLPGIIKKEKPDIMLFLNFNYPILYRGKFITVIHDLTLFFYPETARQTNFIKRLAFNLVMKKALQNSVRVIAVSTHTKNDIIKHFHIDQDKVIVIPEAADDRAFNLPAGKAGYSDSKIAQIKKKYQISFPLILSVGQFRPHKNIPGLLKAFSLLKKDLKNAKLALIGKPDENYRDFWMTLDILGLKKDILMPGFVSDEELASWYKIADVFVFPSFYEGFGLPGLEAMRAGVPVVSSDRTSLPEVYQDAAVYFDPSNQNEIADKIKLVLSDKSLKRKLVLRGKQIAGTYSWQKTAEETLELIKSIK